MNRILCKLLASFALIFLVLKCPSPLKAEEVKSQKNEISSLSLCGVILTKKKSSSLVVLKDEADGKIHFFTEGDRFRDYTIVQIYENRIVFQKKDVLYQLFFKKKVDKRSKPMQVKEPMKVLPSPDKKKNSKVIKKEFSREEAEKRIQMEWQILITGTEIVPNWEDGKINGFKIIRLPGGSILSELGIHENDVIKSINGSVLNDSQALREHFQNYRYIDDFKITLLRRQKIVVIECALKIHR